MFQPSTGWSGVEAVPFSLMPSRVAVSDGGDVVVLGTSEGEPLAWQRGSAALSLESGGRCHRLAMNAAGEGAVVWSRPESDTLSSPSKTIIGRIAGGGLTSDILVLDPQFVDITCAEVALLEARPPEALPSSLAAVAVAAPAIGGALIYLVVVPSGPREVTPEVRPSAPDSR